MQALTPLVPLALARRSNQIYAVRHASRVTTVELVTVQKLREYAAPGVVTTLQKKAAGQVVSAAESLLPEALDPLSAAYNALATVTASKIQQAAIAFRGEVSLSAQGMALLSRGAIRGWHPGHHPRRAGRRR